MRRRRHRHTFAIALCLCAPVKVQVCVCEMSPMYRQLRMHSEKKTRTNTLYYLVLIGLIKILEYFLNNVIIPS